MKDSPKICIGNLSKAHDFQKDNQFIQQGYRINFNSTRLCLKSLFMVHNETINIWSHILASLIFTFLIVYSSVATENTTRLNGSELVWDLKSSISDSLAKMENLGSLALELETNVKEKLKDFCAGAKEYGWEQEAKIKEIYNELKAINASEKFEPILDKFKEFFRWMDHNKSDENSYNHDVSIFPLIIFLASGLVGFMASSLCHIFSAHSHPINKLVFRIDYAGICLLIAGSSYPLIYYFFYCIPHYVWLYQTGITLSSFIVFLISLTESFIHSDAYMLRSIIYSTLCFLAIIPMVHSLYLPDSAKIFNSLFNHLILSWSCYGLGVLVYVTRFPERYWPKKFDFCGHSHNI